MKKVFVSILALSLGVLTVFGTGCTKKQTELIMATNAEFPPYEYYDGDKIVGIDAEIAQAIADELGATLVIEDMQFDSILASVQTGKADMGVAGMTITEDRLQNVDFSIPYATAMQVIIVPEDSDITTPDDLAGRPSVFSSELPVTFMRMTSRMLPLNVTIKASKR